MGSVCIPFSSRTLLCRTVSPVSAATVSGSWCLLDLLCMKGLVHLVFSIPSGSYHTFCLLCCRVPWALRMRFDGDISFRTMCSKVPKSLWIIWYWVSVFVFICCRKRLRWWWQSKLLSYAYSRMLWGSLYSYVSLVEQKCLVFSQIPGWSNLMFLLGHPSSVGTGPTHFMKCAWKPIRYWLVPPSSFVPFLHQCILQAGHWCKLKDL